MTPEGIIRVYGTAEYQFHGNTSILMDVKEVTEDKIIGWEYWESPYDYEEYSREDAHRLVVNRDKIAGWSDYE